MREGALFATMFGLGAGAVLVGVTVSRLVIGQPPERPADERPVLAAEESVPAVAEAVAAEAAPPAPGAQGPPRPAPRRGGAAAPASSGPRLPGFFSSRPAPGGPWFFSPPSRCRRRKRAFLLPPSRR